MVKLLHDPPGEVVDEIVDVAAVVVVAKLVLNKIDKIVL